MPSEQAKSAALLSENGHDVGREIVGAVTARERFDLLARMMSEGKLQSVTVERFPLSETRRASELSATGHVRGKIVVEIAETARGSGVSLPQVGVP